MSCHSTFFFFSCLLYTQTHSYISSKTLIPTFFCLNILLSAVYRELLWLPNKYAVSLHPMMTFHSFSPYCFLSPQHLEIFVLFSYSVTTPLASVKAWATFSVSFNMGGHVFRTSPDGRNSIENASEDWMNEHRVCDSAKMICSLCLCLCCCLHKGDGEVGLVSTVSWLC